MRSGGRLALGAGASLAALAAAAFLFGGGGTRTGRMPYLVQLSETAALISQAPAARAPAPAPLPSPPADVPPADAGIWSTPAEFAPPE